MLRLFLIAACLMSKPALSVVYERPPEDFQGDRLHVVAAFIESGPDVLFMRIAAHKNHGNTWAIPGGKVEVGESRHSAIQRELVEETGLRIDCEFIKTVFVRSRFADFTYHMFKANVGCEKPTIVLSAEHTAIAWWTLDEALKQDLMEDEAECIHIAYPATMAGDACDNSLS